MTRHRPSGSWKLVVVVGLLLGGCDLASEAEHAPPVPNRVDASGCVGLTAAEREALDLKVEAATLSTLVVSSLRFGLVTTAPSDEALLVAPVAGRIQASPSVALGEEVHAGDPILSFEPLLDPVALSGLRTQALEVEGQLQVARARIGALESERDRVRELLVLQLTTPADVKRAEADLLGEQARVEALTRSSAALNLTVGGPGPLLAPIAGRVVELQARAGDVVAQGTRLARIVREGRRWIAVSVPPADPPGTAYRVQPGTSDLVEAQLLTRGSVIGPDGTRTDLLVLPTEASLLPGLTVAVEVLNAPSGVVVPAHAVMSHGQGSVVFLEISEGRYKPRAVTVVARSGMLVLLGSGVDAGQRVVIQGAAALLGELGHAGAELRAGPE
jgi:membrane fusion protein, heavy metal efflux system